MERLERLLKKANELPREPGVYLMKNKSGDIIYVGKAKALKNRVTQYFRNVEKHQIKVYKMVEHVEDFDYIITHSEFEALILECSLIKQYQPKYNILLKDDKGYSYIKITNEDYPRISGELQKLDDGAKYIGPFTSSRAVRQSVAEAVKVFKLPTCNRVFPRDFRKARPCLNAHIGQCMAVCTGKISRRDYADILKEALDYIQSGSEDSLKQMQRQMEAHAENMEFEKAAQVRDRMQAIRRINEKQKVVSMHVPQQDVFAIVRGSGKMCLEILRFDGGRLYDSESFFFDETDDLESARYELITQFYSIRSNIPKRITLDGPVSDEELLSQWLSQKAEKAVKILVPQRGEQAKLVDMCRNNAAQHLAFQVGRTARETSALDELAQLLGLQKPPEYIESYDISHTAGEDNVAGMVVFKGGRPYKKAYKRFAIKGFTGQDDYGSMAEVLERRFRHYLEDEDENSTFKTLPDLILLDGGKGQVHAVLPVMERLGINVPVFGMVKDNKHKTRAIATGGGEIAINSTRRAFTLVSSIQDEVHRFAITYHRKKHSKNTLATTLTRIEGVGDKRAKALLRHFKTMKAISEADVEALAAVPGISRQTAEKIHGSFRAQ